MCWPPFVNMKISYKPSLKERAKWLRNNMTLAEVLLWNKLKGKQMFGYDFDRQKPILGFIVDFFCKQLKLIIEVDGFTHDYKMEYDKQRQIQLESLGLTLLRFQDVEVKKDIENVTQRIVDWINEYTSQHTPAAATPLV